MLHLETVESETFSVLKKLMELPSLTTFSLVGGTALSLKYGHRKSIDLDLFSIEAFDNEIVLNEIRDFYKSDFIIEGKPAKFGIFGFIKDIKIFAVRNLPQLINHLTGQKIMTPIDNSKIDLQKTERPAIDFSEIIGHEAAKRGLLIAASGGHNVAFYGPPGTGKTMLARAFSGILPELDKDKIIEQDNIWKNICKELDWEFIPTL